MENLKFIFHKYNFYLFNFKNVYSIFKIIELDSEVSEQLSCSLL